MKTEHDKESIHPFRWEDKYTIYFFVKVSALTLIFSILWMFLFPQEKERYTHLHNEKDTPGSVWEWNTVTTNTKEVDILIQEIFDENVKIIDEDEHNAPYFSNARKRYNEICSEYSDICDITTRDGSYSEHEKLMYQAILIYKFKLLSAYLDHNIEDSLQYIKLFEDTSPWSRRWSATSTYVKMNTTLINSADEFWQVLTHELWHTIDFTVLKWYARTKDAAYTEFGKIRRPIDDPSIDYYSISWLDESTRRWDASFRDFASGYGMRWMYEDLAEFNNLRINHHSYLRSLARTNPTIQRKYDFFAKEIYDGQYLKNTYQRYPDTGERVWDTTQIY